MPSLLPARAPPPPDRAAAHTWHWYAARAGIGLLVLALLGLLLVLHRQEQEEHRAALIRDVLWVEQNIQFSLDRDVDQLRDLPQEMQGAATDPRQLELHAAILLRNSPGLVQVALLDTGGQVRGSVPAGAGGEAGFAHDTSEPAYRLALSTGKPSYSPPRLAGGDPQIEVYVPYSRGGALAGTVVGVYSLRSMLADVVPWWLAEKHRVTIRDASGAVLAAKSTVEAQGRPELTQQAALDPPGYGLLLHVESYGSETRPLRNVLATTILSLAATVFWTVWSLRRHIQRRVEIEHQLRQEHAFRKAMEDSLETGMRAVDLEGRIVYVNRAFCEMVGYGEAELLGSASPPYWPPEESARIQATVAAARTSGAPHVGLELELVRKGGGRFDALLYEAPLVDAEGRQAGWMGSMLDITERKRARERVRMQEEKLAATARLVTMGEMASAIAHELNQPLSAIASYCTGSLNMIDAGQADPGELRDALEKTAQQAQRAGRIIRRVHDFVRKSEGTRTRMEVNATVREAVGFAGAEARKRGVRIATELSRAPLELSADPVLLQQVVLNLVRNAMDASAETPPAQREVVVRTAREGAVAIVSVTDHGCGLTPDVALHLFDPFFSTKPDGMGMGLSICRSVVEAHRGRLWAQANPEGGAIFLFSLPLEDA